MFDRSDFFFEKDILEVWRDNTPEQFLKQYNAIITMAGVGDIIKRNAEKESELFDEEELE